MSTQAWLDSVVVESLRDQFPEASVSEQSTEAAPSHLVGLIAFQGERGKGVLGIVACSGSLEDSAPDIGGLDLDHEDWIGEMANQALGRIKRELGQRGVALHASLPVVLRGAGIRVNGGDSVRSYVVRRSPHVLNVWIDLTPFESTEPTRTEGADEGALRGGDTLFFP